MAHLIIADGKVHDNEMNTFYQIGKQHFGCSRKEISQIMVQIIQLGFVPRHEALY